jgi:transaldolase/glucose-6-phosphate isomerase
VVYVESLVGPDTVSTIPEATLDAFRDHGTVRPRAVCENLEEAEARLGELSAHGIDLGRVSEHLLAQGLAAFDDDLARLLEAIAARLADAGVSGVGVRTGG